MLTANEIRQQFLDFFRSKGHEVVPSAPIVIKNDPTLLFTNAGMNQFKDYFLGNRTPEHTRIADTQKCLRVSGKHNDLEEVGVDTYHHTMFEMLGNWSFGDYFKEEAIAWSWELLTTVYGIPKDKLYVTVFGGDAAENLDRDDEAYNFWKQHIAEDRILLGNKKDNFWEMGDTGPCGPCSEIHVDCRSDEEKKLVDGKTLVNNDHPQVIEIWNNVFMQFNRLKDGTLEPLPAKHVDTGMGLERLVRVLQGKQSNYDTDLFTGTISAIEHITGRKYSYTDSKKDVAFRVLSDHIRAIGFTIADGQLPSNTGAGYVIRRILRRAVRYYYSYLDYKQPLLHRLMPVLAKQFENVFSELHQQIEQVSNIVRQEEEGFLRTIDNGFARIERNFKSSMDAAVRIKHFLSANSIEVELEYSIPDSFKAIGNHRLDVYIPKYDLGIEVYYSKLQASLNDRIDAFRLMGIKDVIALAVDDINNGIVNRQYFENIFGKQLPNGNLTEISSNAKDATTVIKNFFVSNSIDVILEHRNNMSNLVLDIYTPEFNLGFEVYKEKETAAIDDQINAYKLMGIGNVIKLSVDDINTGIINRQYFETLFNRKLPNGNLLELNGKIAFELYDTFGFPFDLTKLILKERNWTVNEAEFESEMQQQKKRSRAATALDTDDWIVLKEGNAANFVGYDSLEADASVMKYRKVSAKGKVSYQLVLDTTPFYAESGGQVGDTGELIFPNDSIQVVDTKKEDGMTIHFAEVLPENISAPVHAKVDRLTRVSTEVHHSATHLLHAALREVLGRHVAQKGSLVNDEHLRFDFSHFAKVTDEEIARIEAIVNEKIRENIPVVIKTMPKEDAIALGAMALFGEKYGNVVRVVIMDPNYSIELCGGTHVGATGQLGFFKITAEAAVAAGVRRMEAVSGRAAEHFINGQLQLIANIQSQLKNAKDPLKAIEKLQEERSQFEKHVEHLEARQLVGIRNELLTKDEIINEVTFVGQMVSVSSADALKKLCFDLKSHLNDHVIVLCANIDGKPFVVVGVDEKVVAAKGLDAGKIIKEHVAPLIKGGGGGQKTLATAGGQDVAGLQVVIEKVRGLL